MELSLSKRREDIYILRDHVFIQCVAGAVGSLRALRFELSQAPFPYLDNRRNALEHL